MKKHINMILLFTLFLLYGIFFVTKGTMTFEEQIPYTKFILMAEHGDVEKIIIKGDIIKIIPYEGNKEYVTRYIPDSQFVDFLMDQEIEASKTIGSEFVLLFSIFTLSFFCFSLLSSISDNNIKHKKDVSLSRETTNKANRIDNKKDIKTGEKEGEQNNKEEDITSKQTDNTDSIKNDTVKVEKKESEKFDKKENQTGNNVKLNIVKSKEKFSSIDNQGKNEKKQKPVKEDPPIVEKEILTPVFVVEKDDYEEPPESTNSFEGMTPEMDSTKEEPEPPMPTFEELFEDESSVKSDKPVKEESNDKRTYDSKPAFKAPQSGKKKEIPPFKPKGKREDRRQKEKQQVKSSDDSTMPNYPKKITEDDY